MTKSYFNKESEKGSNSNSDDSENNEKKKWDKESEDFKDSLNLNGNNDLESKFTKSFNNIHTN